jgi:hypothetical protein
VADLNVRFGSRCPTIPVADAPSGTIEETVKIYQPSLNWDAHLGRCAALVLARKQL